MLLRGLLTAVGVVAAAVVAVVFVFVGAFIGAAAAAACAGAFGGQMKQVSVCVPPRNGPVRAYRVRGALPLRATGGGR